MWLASRDAAIVNRDWASALHPLGSVATRHLAGPVSVRVVPLTLVSWSGPGVTMAEDCNKRGGRIAGDRGELSCAEVEIVKRLRAAGWEAAWVQAFRCGRQTWARYIRDWPDFPATVLRIPGEAGHQGGHPDVIAWLGQRVIAIESKGPGDALKPSQVEWFAKALRAGIAPGDIGLVEWRAARWIPQGMTASATSRRSRW